MDLACRQLPLIKTTIIFYSLLFIFTAIPVFAQQDFSIVTTLVGISEPGASYGQAVSWCDIDNDGDLDLAFSYNHGGTFRLYRNDDSHFTDITSAAGRASIELFDAAGRRIAVLGSGDFEAGTHEIIWNGLRSDGRTAPSGVYFCRLKSEFGDADHTMVLVR